MATNPGQQQPPKPKPDPKLRAALNRAKTRKMYFAVVFKDVNRSKLLVSPKKMLGAHPDVAKAKKDTGGGRLLAFGMTLPEKGGGLLFECIKKPPANLNRLIREMAKTQAKMMVKVKVQIAGLQAKVDKELVTRYTTQIKELAGRLKNLGDGATRKARDSVATLYGYLKSRRLDDFENKIKEAVAIIEEAEKSVKTANGRRRAQANHQLKELGGRIKDLGGRAEDSLKKRVVSLFKLLNSREWETKQDELERGLREVTRLIEVAERTGRTR